MPENMAGKMETRWVAFVTAIALFFGGWWLQNQYHTTLRLQQQLTEFITRVDDKYVEKDELASIIERLSRIENALEARRKSEQKLDRFGVIQ